ncbi:FAD/NAD(P)-binding domain-containing protein [Stipitochalara longipes BDJ]|nr:FAD/NAD(P)-binding domain-containing protein [Stipitochalara longipes BDJ]
MSERKSDRSGAAVVIIGAGMSGMCLAIDLIRRNYTRDFVILEKGSQVGGTWNDNQYPGCSCDIWSHLYSYSFEGNPNWTALYPGRDEIHAYLVKLAEKWKLYHHIRFNSMVEEARWDGQNKKWNAVVNILDGKDTEYSPQYTISADFLVSAVGQLNYPQYPAIRDIDSFGGKMMHTARWDAEYCFDGKRVAVVGNGASAAQAIPEIAKTANSVTVFQRTPNWVVPRYGKSIGKTLQAIFRYVPGARRYFRMVLMTVREVFFGFAVHESSLNGYVRKLCRKMMLRQIPHNEKLREALTPNYSPGCKRVLLSDDFYFAMNKAHVKLETSPIEKFTSEGISTGRTLQDFDLIVLATGFRTTEFMFPMKIYGSAGQAIDKLWHEQGGARAYLGISVESLPNFAMLYGPNTNLGHNSIILMIEAQSRYISTLIIPVLRARGKGASLCIQPKPQRIASYNDDIHERLGKTAFADPGCNSWYKNDAGIITNNWYGTVVEYQKQTSVVAWDDYILSGSSPGLTLPKGKVKIGRVVEEVRFIHCVISLSALALLAIVGGELYLGTIKWPVYSWQKNRI